jgi:hypothetical protein
MLRLRQNIEGMIAMSLVILNEDKNKIVETIDEILDWKYTMEADYAGLLLYVYVTSDQLEKAISETKNLPKDQLEKELIFRLKINKIEKELLDKLSNNETVIVCSYEKEKYVYLTPSEITKLDYYMNYFNKYNKSKIITIDELKTSVLVSIKKYIANCNHEKNKINPYETINKKILNHLVSSENLLFNLERNLSLKDYIFIIDDLSLVEDVCSEYPHYPEGLALFLKLEGIGGMTLDFMIESLMEAEVKDKKMIQVLLDNTKTSEMIKQTYPEEYNKYKITQKIEEF